jgi:hypothetical protein
LQPDRNLPSLDDLVTFVQSPAEFAPSDTAGRRRTDHSAIARIDVTEEAETLLLQTPEKLPHNNRS